MSNPSPVSESILRVFRVSTFTVFTEVSFFVLGLSVLLTLWLSQDFLDFLTYLMSVDEEGDAVMLVLMFVAGSVLSIYAAFSSSTAYRLPRMIAPVFMVSMASLISIEYMRLLFNVASLWQLPFLAYQAIYFFILAHAIGNMVASGYPTAPEAHLVEVLYASIIVVGVFLYSYGGFISQPFSWVYPVLHALLIWQIIDTLLRRFGLISVS